MKYWILMEFQNFISHCYKQQSKAWICTERTNLRLDHIFKTENRHFIGMTFNLKSNLCCYIKIIYSDWKHLNLKLYFYKFINDSSQKSSEVSQVPKQITMNIHPNTWTEMFITAVFIIARAWKQLILTLSKYTVV